MTQADWRDRLRNLPVFSGTLPDFDPDAAPTDPLDLFEEWLGFAIDSGVSQPQAMALATAGSSGDPSVRTLLLKDITAEGLWFATLSTSPKGHDLAQNPRASVVLYWREQGRQIRVSGAVEAGSRELAESDFLRRHPNARAIAAVGTQSQPIADQAVYDRAIAEQQARIAANPDYVPEDWVAYLLRPQTWEFWQAARERDQVRLRYSRNGDQWSRDILWP
ncbi:pyridoxine/pyridoxamine 5'-phosphate oxidase [Lacisediminihabitans changchengi]|uniref:Pyridoxal 5'-phosphate synthase n=1 Tax=Lacisediminihabitans changchengi TaxID=2787634 RepID=A0A934SSS9_9MICO|nr:pyridoxal 5'-phosphate synthase [Lacisediminihabitans changchengi]MBK4347474.1 pyridoxal 5'-phosphate synthase [Lacisediminihabitans changchengi]